MMKRAAEISPLREKPYKIGNGPKNTKTPERAKICFISGHFRNNPGYAQ